MYRPSKNQMRAGLSQGVPMVPPTDNHVVIETQTRRGITQQVWRKDKAEKLGLIEKD